MQKIKQHFVITKNGEKISYRDVIAVNEPLAQALIVDHIECNWGPLVNEDGGDYGFEVLSTEAIDTATESNVY